jgi:reactive intermediate/imine deaminase
MSKQRIETASAPAAIGTYSQAIRTAGTIYLSGQIGLDPATGQLVDGIEAQVERVFANLAAVAAAAGGSFDDMVKLTVYLVDLAHFGHVNDAMHRHFRSPYPARSTVAVSGLPRGALVEVDAIMHLRDFPGDAA